MVERQLLVQQSRPEPETRFHNSSARRCSAQSVRRPIRWPNLDSKTFQWPRQGIFLRQLRRVSHSRTNNSSTNDFERAGSQWHFPLRHKWKREFVSVGSRQWTHIHAGSDDCQTVAGHPQLNDADRSRSIADRSEPGTFHLHQSGRSNALFPDCSSGFQSDRET